MRNALIVIAAGIVAAASPASAQTSLNVSPRADSSPDQAQTSAGAPAATANDNRRICLNVELTGSRMVRRVCRTQAEWDARGGLESTH